jgi:hypothetical protein
VPSGPRTEGQCSTVTRSTTLSAEIGEAHYAVLIQPGEDIILGAGQKMRVLSVIAVEEEDSPYVGLLQVEPVG